MREISLYIPRWFYTNNLGDSIHSFFIPKIIKKVHPDCKLTVVTFGELIDLMKLNPYVDYVRSPFSTEIGNYEYWKNYAFNDKKIIDRYAVFAEWHPKLWSYWNAHFNQFSDHPSANILTVNSLLQLGMEKFLFDGSDLHTNLILGDFKKDRRSIGIVPATKLAGRPLPHPGCDGIGLRFNGDQGESWRLFVESIKKLDPSIHIIEYSNVYLGFGDEHVPHMNWLNLAKQCYRPEVVVTSDGGMHHMFNLVNTKVVLLGAQKINKPCFFKMSNSKYYEDLHIKCLDRCYNTITTLSGWPDLDKSCDNSCQKVDPNLLAHKVYEDYFK
jgi:hypothetical protein